MKIRNIINGLLQGRNGLDELNILLIWIYIIITIINIFINNFYTDITGLILIILIIYRSYSKNIYRRQKENHIFITIIDYIKRPFINIIRNIKDKDHVYKRCSKCKTTLKLPLPKSIGINHAKCPNCKKRLTILNFKKEKIEIITNK